MPEQIAEFQTIQKTRADLQRATRLSAAHWLIVVLSLMLTLSVWYITRNQVEERTHTRFERQADQIVELLVERMRHYEDGLIGGVAAIHSSNDQVTQAVWRTFANNMRLEERYPGINGIGVIFYLPDRNALEAFLVEKQAERPSFQVFPEHQETEFYPITYIEPVETNRQAVGLDMAHEQKRYQAAKRARNTGMTTITGPIILVQDTEQTPGFLFYEPMYTRSGEFMGMVYAPFVMKKLMKGTLAEKNRQVSMRISDAGDTLYNEQYTQESRTGHYFKQIDASMYGRTWSFELAAKPSFYDDNSSRQPAYILACGILVDVLLLWFFFYISHSNRKALEFADMLASSYIRQIDQLETTQKELMRSNDELERFAYVCSHDLQEPLRMIRAYSGKLEEQIKTQISGDEKAQKYLHFMTQGAENAQELVSDILAYARISQESERFEQVDLALILSRVDEDLYQSLMATSGVLKYGDLPAVNGNGTLLYQLFCNIVSNAIKYRREGVSPVVTIKVDDLEDYWQVSISDNGIGIDSQHYHRIFEPFKRLHRRDRYGGTGIGLAICRKIVDYHNGHIWVESSLERGSTFFFTLPKNEFLADTKE